MSQISSLSFAMRVSRHRGLSRSISFCNSSDSTSSLLPSGSLGCFTPLRLDLPALGLDWVRWKSAPNLTHSGFDLRFSHLRDPSSYAACKSSYSAHLPHLKLPSSRLPALTLLDSRLLLVATCPCTSWSASWSSLLRSPRLLSVLIVLSESNKDTELRRSDTTCNAR